MSATRLEDLKPRPGERFVAWFRRFLVWVRQFRLIKADPRVRMQVIPGHGTLIGVDLENTDYVGSFAVSLAALEATIGEGYVNEIMPTIDGVGLDGLTAEGAEVDVPTVSLSDGPNEKLRSWLCLQVQIDPATGRLLDPAKHKDVVTVIHTSLLDPGHRDGGSPDQNHFGRQPIAVIKWEDSTTPIGVWQHVLHDLNHRFIPGAKGARGRHFFWPK